MASPGRRFHVAVFPLTDAVLFPGVTLPIQVMDERYGKMFHEIEARGWPLAISLVVPGEDDSQVKLSTVCGAGHVRIQKEYPDGRCDVYVHGEQRVRLIRVLQQEPYIVMEAEEIEPGTEPEARQKKKKRDLKELL